MATEWEFVLAGIENRNQARTKQQHTTEKELQCLSKIAH
jgi:hypothetical protein